MAPEFGKPIHQLALIPADILKKHRVHEQLDTRFRSAARLLQALWREDRLYYTSTAQKVFMRVRVDPKTLDPTGPPEFIAAIDNADDFCIDEDAGFAYVTRHRGNTLDRVPLAPRHGSEVRHIAGDPFDPVVVGPSSAYWGREPGDVGKVMYVTTDGGTTAPPDGIVRNAALVRVELKAPTAS